MARLCSCSVESVMSRLKSIFSCMFFSNFLLFSVRNSLQTTWMVLQVILQGGNVIICHNYTLYTLTCSLVLSKTSAIYLRLKATVEHKNVYVQMNRLNYCVAGQ